MKATQALPPEKQIEAVSKKLMELNPGFDGKASPSIQGGVVTAFRFVADNVTDILPVRALVGLQELSCGGSDTAKGRLSDLSPLQGMAITRLWCGHGQVADLSPLKGMPLTRLSIDNTQVRDLSPLQGMPLASLNCGSTDVSDLSPLRGMPLSELTIAYTLVSDLSPLVGMRLTT